MFLWTTMIYQHHNKWLRIPVLCIIFVLFLYFCHTGSVKAQDTTCAQSPPSESSISLIPVTPESDGPLLPSTSCQNSDFSLGSFSNWSGCSGKWCADTLPGSTRCNGNYVPFNPPCNNPGQPWYNNPTGGHFTIENPGADACIPALNMVFTGDAHSALIGNRACNNNNAGGYVDQLTYHIVYDPSHSFFIYRCAVVLSNIQDPTHNTANRRPRFTFVILDHLTGDTIDPVCGFYDLWPGDGITTWNQTGLPLNFYWKDWSTIGVDLSGLTGITPGQLLDVVFMVHGCAFTAHPGYAYISAYCGSMTIQVAGCEGSGEVTMTGPPGFTQYVWRGPYCASCPPNPPTYIGNPVTITTAEGAVTGNIFTLTVTALNGCQVQNIQQIIAFTNVIAAFTHDSTCVGQGMQFTDQSTTSQNQIVAWDWNFGDGSPIVHLQNPVHIYTAPNTYTVTLIAYSSDNCSNTTTSQVTIDPLPTPSFTTGPNSVCLNVPGNVYITQPGKSNYLWIIPSQATVTAGGTTLDNSVTLTWSTIGTYPISINYTDPVTLCTAATPTNFTVTVNPLPVPAIGGPVAACAGSTGNIYSTLSGMSNYQWIVSAGGTINSGGTATDNTVTVTWNTAGSQTVAVNFNDLNGCTALAPTNYSITVNPLPVPLINGPSSVCMNSTGTYTTDAGMTNYVWSVSAGGTITSGTGTNSITVLWTTIGAKTITVNYSDANGCTATVPSNYPVNVNTLPVPSLNGLNTICSGNSTTYTTDVGMNNYVWLVSAGGTITAGGSTTDNSVTVMWNTAGAQTVSVNYSMGTGCTAGSPEVLDVNVKPKPSVTNAANSTICSSTTTNIVLLASLPLTTFTWTATGSSGNVSGFSASGGPVISQTLTNSGLSVETVDYAVTPSLNGCDGPVAHYIVTVDPVADAYFNPNGQTICSGATTNISILSHVAGATFNWNGTGSSGNMGGFGSGSTSSITQTLTNTGSGPGFVTYTISPSFNGCPGIPNSVIVTVNPLPPVTYTICNDALTTTAAQPFKLKGGLPIGGTYSGTGVNSGIFYPSTGIGNHTITYSYLNTWGCTANATQVITVVNPPVFICNNTLTDIRDNSQYPTVKIGTQCWMSTNLNYGSIISSTQMQRDNCLPEKYCFNDNPANCISYGGLYQWDEMMQYNNAPAEQGFCPPAWHVPTENEWTALFNFYISNGFAGAPLKYTGYSGFNALLSGTRFNNVNWNFSNFAVMLWSSTSEGTDKAWAHGMNIYNPSVSYYPSSTTHAFNLRCIKD